jgi:hypothetical protein
VDISVGDGSNKKIIIKDAVYIIESTAEAFGKPLVHRNYCHINSGVDIYGRVSCSGTTETLFNMAVYGVGR